jgi:hypothetical protein
MLTFVEVEAQTADSDGGKPAPVYVDRAKIPGGWLVRTISDGLAMTFVPDPDHLWDGSSLKPGRS